jgi:hypothetical protein
MDFTPSTNFLTISLTGGATGFAQDVRTTERVWNDGMLVLQRTIGRFAIDACPVRRVIGRSTGARTK